MKRKINFPVILTLLFFGFLILFLWGTQQMPVTDPVESNYALTAKEMVTSGDWISPQIYGEYWYDKPALFYWLLSASYSVFGFSNFASRLPAALCGAFSVVLLGWYVRRIVKDTAAAVWAAAFLGTSLEFWIISHAIITDNALFLFSLPTFFSAYIGITEKSWKHMTIAYGAAALACLTKGPVGLLLPGLILFLFVLTRRSFSAVLRLFAPTGILLFCLIALPWYYEMYALHGADFIDQFFGLHNMTRIVASEHPADDHFYYYLLVLPASLLPWTGLSFYSMIAKWKERTPLYTFLMLWCWVVVLFYTLVATKYVTYTYIAVAPGIVLAVLALKDLLSEDGRAAQLSLVIPVALTFIALCAGSYFIPGNFLSFYVIVMYCLFLLYSQWKKKQFRSMLLLTTASMAAGLSCIVYGGLSAYIGTRSTEAMSSYFRELPGTHYVYKSYTPSFNFYTDETPVRIYAEDDEKRDARWEDKHTMPTVQENEVSSAKGPAYIYVPNGSAAKKFAASSLHAKCTEAETFPSGVVYKMEK